MIKNRLRVVALERGYSLLKLTEVLSELKGSKVHYTTVNRFAQDGRPTINTELLELVCKALHIQPGDILTWVDDASPPP